MNRRYLALAVALCAVAGALAAAPPGRAAPRVDTYAMQDLAGTATPPECVSEKTLRTLGSDVAPTLNDMYAVTGLTLLPSGQVFLLDAVCHDVAQFLYDIRRPNPNGTPLTIDETGGMMTLYHEAGHAHGITTEWKAECYGLKRLLQQIALYAPGSYDYWRHYWLYYAERDRLDNYKLVGRCHPPLTALRATGPE